MARKQNDLKALRNMISEAHDILRTTVLPEERSQRAYELLTAAVHLAVARTKTWSGRHPGWRRAYWFPYRAAIDRCRDPPEPKVSPPGRGGKCRVDTTPVQGIRKPARAGPCEYVGGTARGSSEVFQD